MGRCKRQDLTLLAPLAGLIGVLAGAVNAAADRQNIGCAPEIGPGAAAPSGDLLGANRIVACDDCGAIGSGE